MIHKQPFGNTGHKSTVTIFGGAAIGRVNQEKADQVLKTLLKYGVNHIDTAASYGDSELRIGPWMEKHRNDFFLATKTGQRTYTDAIDEIHKSLDRLRVKNVDLLSEGCLFLKAIISLVKRKVSLFSCTRFQLYHETSLF